MWVAKTNAGGWWKTWSNKKIAINIMNLFVSSLSPCICLCETYDYSNTAILLSQATIWPYNLFVVKNFYQIP